MFGDVFSDVWSCRDRVPGDSGPKNIEKNVQNVAIASDDFFSLAKFAIDEEVRLTIVGPEQPLADGLVDFFQARDLAIFGPTKSAAQLEASKAFTKKFLQRHDIPTGSYQIFDEAESALSFVQKQGTPIVIKADGLAAGKGVVVANTFEEAENAIHSMLSENLFGNAGNQIVIEEFLEGEEASFIVMVDGKNILPMATSQDHKRAGEGDTGLNTGGMGAYTPTSRVTSAMQAEIEEKVIKPTLAGLKADGIDYRGTLYAGLMLTDQGVKVLEYNVRFGDPETQVLLPMVADDLVPVLLASATGESLPAKLQFHDGAAIVVVLAAGGYPGSYAKGNPITFPDALPASAAIVHAGTTRDPEGTIRTAGGRVLGVSGQAPTLKAAADLAYTVCDQVKFEDKFLRRDIGHRELNR